MLKKPSTNTNQTVHKHNHKKVQKGKKTKSSPHTRKTRKYTQREQEMKNTESFLCFRSNNNPLNKRWR